METGKGKFFVPNQGSLEGPPGQTKEPEFSGKKLDDSVPLWGDVGGALQCSEITDPVVSDSGVSEEFKGVERLW